MKNTSFRQSHLGLKCEDSSELGLLFPEEGKTKMTLKGSLNSCRHYGVIMNQTTSHRPYMFSYIQAWLDRKQTHTKTCEFSGSVGHQCTGLQAPTWPCLAISCADMQLNCVSSRGNSGVVYTSTGKWALPSLASQTMLLLHAVSVPISHD